MTCCRLVAVERNEVIQIRVSPSEKKAIQQAAKKAGKDVASHIRDSAIPPKRRAGK